MPTETLTQDANATLVAEDEKQLLAVAAQNHLQPDTAQSLQNQFAPLFAQARSKIEESRGIVVTDRSQTLQMKQAGVFRLELKRIRVAGEKARKAIKEESLRRSKAIDGFGNILEDLIATEETRLQAQEDFAEIQEANRKAALKTDREKILVGIQVDPNLYQLGDMSEETFQQLVEGTKLARAAEAERKRKEEAERIEREAKEQAERERIRQENERLKREAAEKEATRVAEVRRRGELHFVRRITMQPLVASGDESGNGFYGDMTDDQFGEVMAGAQNRWAARVKLEKERADAEAERKRVEEERRVAEELAKKEREALEAENARKLAEQKQFADEAAAVAAESVKAEIDRRDALAAEERRKHEEAAAEIRRIAKKEASEAAEVARKERLRLQALSEVERKKSETARAAAESEAHKQRVAREQLEKDIRDAKEKEDARIASEKEAARKAAAAPDKEKLIAYAHAILAIDIPEFTTDNAKSLATTIKAARDKFSSWVIEKADIL